MAENDEKLIMDCEWLSRCGIKDDLVFDVEYVNPEANFRGNRKD